MIYEFRGDATRTESIFGSKLTSPTARVGTSSISAMFVFVCICRHRQRECNSKQLKHFCASTFERLSALIVINIVEKPQVHESLCNDRQPQFSWRRKLLCDSMKISKIDLRCGNFCSNMQIYSNRTHKSIVIRPEMRGEKLSTRKMQIRWLPVDLHSPPITARRHSHPKCLSLGKVNQNN